MKIDFNSVGKILTMAFAITATTVAVSKLQEGIQKENPELATKLKSAAYAAAGSLLGK